MFAVAARAKVAPATAYTYFSSKNHLIAEVYLDLAIRAGQECQRRSPAAAECDYGLALALGVAALLLGLADEVDLLFADLVAVAQPLRVAAEIHVHRFGRLPHRADVQHGEPRNRRDLPAHLVRRAGNPGIVRIVPTSG